MVRAFFMHTVSPLPLNILYSQVFEDEQRNDEGLTQPARKRREIRKESIVRVACQIQSELELAERCVNAPNNIVCENPAEYFADSMFVSGDKRGMFQISSDFFPDSVVLWQSSCNVVYGFVLKTIENRILARAMLRVVMTQLDSQTPIVLQAKETLLKLDKIQAVVNHFLPNGQLLFMTHRVIRQSEKEFDKYNKN